MRGPDSRRLLAYVLLAVAVGGLQTRQRIAWGAYMILSIAIFFLLGVSNPLSAVILLLPVGLDLMREAWRPL